jgi:hypothetical protein
VRVLEPLVPRAQSLRVWADDSAGTSAWEVIYNPGRFFLMVSPELHRGFSGEGQVLTTLAHGDWQSVLPEVRARLRWQTQINASELAREIGVRPRLVEGALAALGARGLIGYDVTTGAYFHREMPFDLEQVEALQPRLRGARKLLATDGVELLKRRGDGTVELTVAGTGVGHHVRLQTDREGEERCTCPWFSRHQGQRGPCKHVLAARLWLAAKEREGAAP